MLNIVLGVDYTRMKKDSQAIGRTAMQSCHGGNTEGSMNWLGNVRKSKINVSAEGELRMLGKQSKGRCQSREDGIYLCAVAKTIVFCHVTQHG